MTRLGSALIGEFFVLGATGGYVGIVAPHASAASTAIAVTTTADELDVDGDCSLREAVQAANTDTAVDTCAAGHGTDVITLAAGTYLLDSELETDAAGVAIERAGAPTTTIDGGSGTRLFVASEGPLTRKDLTLTNGEAGSEEGGAILAVDGKVTITDSVLSHNRARHGGAIATRSGPVDLTGSTLSDNRADIDPLNGKGAAVSSESGDVTIRSSTFVRNSTSNSGGAILAGAGAVDVADSTFSANEAKAGAAIYDSFGDIHLVNSTLDGNITFGLAGVPQGTLHTTTSDIILSGVTLTRTLIGSGAESGGDITLSNSVLTDNEAGDCQPNNDITSKGGNLDSDGTCELDAMTDLTAAPHLGLLADNGGATETRRPEVGSPLIDGGLNSICESADQRGAARPLDGDSHGTAVRDRGALETNARIGPPTTTTTIPRSTPTTVVASQAPVATPIAADPSFTG